MINKVKKMLIVVKKKKQVKNYETVSFPFFFNLNLFIYYLFIVLNLSGLDLRES